jgi:Holliday junction resolvase-like predicted endonuclease
MKINKSSRHSKITGDFSEGLVLYWLSKYGFECASIDHTGIDLIARNPHTNEIMGISVKSRCRNTGKEGQYVSIPKDNFDKAQIACKAFGCVPYFAIVVDEGRFINIFILQMSYLLQIFPIGQRVSGWKMTPKHIEKYRKDPNIHQVRFEYETMRWWQ